MEGRLLLDVIIGQSSSVFELLSSEDQTLLVRGDSLFVLDFSLDVLNGVGGLNVERNSLTCQCLDEDLHRDNIFL